MWDKLRKKAFEGCEILEFVMAMIVGLAILMAIVGVFPGLLHFWGERGDTHAFMEFLDEVLSVVIGIEFLKMLCKPSTGNIIEALIFLIARHMVIQDDNGGGGSDLSCQHLSLFVFRRLMLATKPDKEHNMPNLIHAVRLSQSPEFRKALIRYEKEEAEKSVAEESGENKEV